MPVSFTKDKENSQRMCALSNLFVVVVFNSQRSPVRKSFFSLIPRYYLDTSYMCVYLPVD